MHRLYPDLSAPLAPGEITITGDEAHHAARVRRLAQGDAVDLLDGEGGVARARIVSLGKTGRDGWQLVVAVESVARAEPVRPIVNVASAMPKGPRLAELIDGLSQAGAAAWRPLLTDRGERERCPVERLERVAREASKQSGRAWTMRIEPPITFEESLRATGVIVADASGEPYTRARPPGSFSPAPGSDDLRLLIGAEGGWTADELRRARAAGARVCRFGPHVMRIETAAVVACAIMLDADRAD
ncbi:MAG: RsmE family RNA methyltransferase [Phycisphaerales bacterium]